MFKNTKSSSVSFKEEMSGYFTDLGSINETLSSNPSREEIITFCKNGYDNSNSRKFFKFHAEITINDVNKFTQAPDTNAAMEGYIKSDYFKDEITFEEGSYWNLFKKTRDPEITLMEYHIFFKTPTGEDQTLVGFKKLKNDFGFDLWSDSTTLFSLLYEGKVSEEDEKNVQPQAAGVLNITLSDFIELLISFRSKGADFKKRTKAFIKFGTLFMDKLWEIYGIGKVKSYNRVIPLYTLKGVLDKHPRVEARTFNFSTKDGLGLTLTRFKGQECKNVVITIHGLTTSTDMFIMPEHKNLVSYLIENGYTDVWCLDTRQSCRFSYNLQRHRYTLDDVALYDIPAALDIVRKHVGDNVNIHVIAHCLGSASFMMSLFGGHAKGIRSVICNSVSLHVKVPFWSKCKLLTAPFLVEYVLGIPYVTPNWRYTPGWTIGKLISWIMDLVHRECSNPACHMLSFMWGTGWPALFEYENMDPITHYRLGDLFGGTSMNYFRHVKKMVLAKKAVKYHNNDPKYAALPDDYLTRAREIKTPIFFIWGEKNRVFMDSNRITPKWLESIGMTQHEYKEFPDYGHQDIFMGRKADQKIFHRLIEFLNKHS